MPERKGRGPSPAEVGPPAPPLRTLSQVRAESRPVLSDMSVVIPTLGRPILEHCLAAIAAGEAWPACVVVAHQGEDPSVERLLDRLAGVGIGTRYIPSEARGRAAGVNLGLHHVDTTYAAVIDDDCMMAPDWLLRMREGLHARPDTLLMGRVAEVTDDGTVLLGPSEAVVQERPSLIYGARSSGCIGLSMPTYRALGPLDEDPRLRLAEDTEFGYRALKLGTKIAYDPEIVLWHHHRRTEAGREIQVGGYAFSHGAFYGKYIRAGDGHLVLRAIIHIGRAGLRWVMGVLRRNPRQRANGRAYVTHLIPGFLAGFRSAPTRRDG